MNDNSRISENSFNTTLEKIKRIDSLPVKLISYNKISTLNSIEDLTEVREMLAEKENSLIIKYNLTDTSLSSLKVYQKQNFKHSSEPNSIEMSNQKKKRLNKMVQKNQELYQLTFSGDNQEEFTTFALFEADELIYDKFLSNVLVTKVKNLKSDKSKTISEEELIRLGIDINKGNQFSTNQSSTYRTYDIGGNSISLYNSYMPWVEVGYASVKTTVYYRVDCEPGGTGNSYCHAYILSVNTNGDHYHHGSGSRSAVEFNPATFGEGVSGGTVYYAIAVSAAGASFTISTPPYGPYTITLSGDSSLARAKKGSYYFNNNTLPVD